MSDTVCPSLSILGPLFTVTQATVMLYQSLYRPCRWYKGRHFDGARPEAPRSFISFLFAMLPLRELALLLVAVSGSASAAIGPGADLPIVNANIAPDGFLRP